jgi:hypothetical protein
MTPTHRLGKAVAISSLILLAPAAAFAAEEDPCSGFQWPMETELSWMKSADSQPLDAGAEIAAPAGKAIALKLQPAGSATLPVKSSTKHEIAADSYSGWFKISALPQDGLYQVTLSHHAWIDAVQNGEAAPTAAFTGRPDCGIVRKSVRFNLKRGSVTVQIAGSPSETVKVIVREVK